MATLWSEVADLLEPQKLDALPPEPDFPPLRPRTRALIGEGVGCAPMNPQATNASLCTLVRPGDANVHRCATILYTIKSCVGLTAKFLSRGNFTAICEIARK